MLSTSAHKTVCKFQSEIVTPAKAGVQRVLWIPAFSGMTSKLLQANGHLIPGSSTEKANGLDATRRFGGDTVWFKLALTF
jgi:hypothetical protein